MTRTVRVEPITEEREEAFVVSGWRVVDITDPNLPSEISRHDSEPQAIEAARQFEHETSYDPGSDPDDTQDYDGSDVRGGKEY